MTEKSEEYLCDLRQHNQNCKADLDESCYVEPANIVNVWYRLPEIITDPASNQLSCSRMVLAWMGMMAMALTADAIYLGRIEAVTSMVMAVAATAAGVYFISTASHDYRWKKRDKE